ncbi:hypothetical protein [Poseidonibacter ostreae]|uniref:Uncharacterized protein n=1 Tax=Poseidonibacter ostreae TaxID=2654171 RepID=A0A6L4WX56_9BACT|nr:hypothetical protein [Poseidonibacter ostreae]KAB7891333.1 hypothetical protein GBG19_00420 [Poseidonibacter ostreae]
MKRIILSLGLIIGGTTLSDLLPTNLSPNSISIKADVIEDNINIIKKLTAEQDLVANAIELYVELYGVAPSNIDAIKSAGLIDGGFSFGGSYSIGGTTFAVTTSKSATLTYQKDYYLNNYDRGRVVEPSISGNNFITKYYLDKEALHTLNYVGAVDAVQPTSPSGSNGKSWYDTIRKKLFYYYGTWTTLDAKRLYIVKGMSELPIAPIENDAGIVLTTTSLLKYLYVDGAWRNVGDIPFDYNTGF